MSLFSELRRRNVFRVAVAYLASVWLVLQIADIVLDGFDAPAWILRVLLISSALGFPLAIVLAWFYELTFDDGKAPEVDTVETDRFLGRKIDFAIIAILVLAVIFLVADNYLPDKRSTVNSIAVLPFDDLSAGRDQEYFSRGISEEIINLLTQIDGLRVVARTSAFSLMDQENTIVDIANKLNVRYVLEGSVRRYENKVRITAQLIDAESDNSLWSNNFDREMTNIFSIQDDVAGAIIDNLPDTIAGTRPTRGRPTDDAEAYTLFLRARNYLNDFNVHEALEAVNESIERDPSFAEAFELRASIYWASAGEILSAAEAQEKMGIDASRALDYDGGLALARAMSATGNLANYSLASELAAFEQAAKSEPNNPAILEPLVFNLKKAGYLTEALKYAGQLLSVDPYSTLAHGRWQSGLMACSRTDDAVRDIGGKLAGRLNRVSADNNLTRDDVGRFDDDDWFVAEIALLNNFDDLAIERITARLEDEGMDSSWVADLINGARYRATGEAHLDRRIPEIIADAMEDANRDSDTTARWLSSRLSRLYLHFGYLDRYYDIIEARGLSASSWSNAEDLLAAGISYPDTGFTAHARFLDIADALGIIDVWEKRGPPDICERGVAGWSCDMPVTPCTIE